MTERTSTRPRRADDLVSLLPLVARGLHHQAWPVIQQAGLTNAQFWFLKWVAFHGSITVSELADFLKLRAPTVTPVLNDLEKKGLLTRRRDAKDRRVVRVEVSPKGVRFLRSIEAHVAKAAAQAIEGVATQDREAATRVLRVLADSLDLTHATHAKTTKR